MQSELDEPTVYRFCSICSELQLLDPELTEWQQRGPISHSRFRWRSTDIQTCISMSPVLALYPQHPATPIARASATVDASITHCRHHIRIAHRIAKACKLVVGESGCRQIQSVTSRVDRRHGNALSHAAPLVSPEHRRTSRRVTVHLLLLPEVHRSTPRCTPERTTTHKSKTNPQKQKIQIFFYQNALWMTKTYS